MGKAPKSQVVTNKLDPATTKMQKEVFDRARQVSQQPFTQYQGATVAGADPMSASGVAGFRNAGSRFGSLFDEAMGHSVGDMSFGGGAGGQTFGKWDLDPYGRAARTGADALGGDSSAINRLMNPYQDQVIDRLGGQFDKMRTKAALGASDLATQGGAFGGDRHALLMGERLGEIDRAQGDATANLLHGGYNDMIGRAGTAANLGLGAGGLSLGAEQAAGNYGIGIGDQRLRGQGMAADYALGQGNQRLAALGQAGQAAQGGMDASGRLFGAGDYYRGLNQQQMDDNQRRFNEQRDWGIRGLDILKGGMSGMPYGTSQEQPLHRNAFAGAAGGAITGAKLGGPWGAVAGGLGGLLFG